MLHGVAVDSLTEHFLGIAADRPKANELYGNLRVFFHDARNRLNSLKIGLYLGKRGSAAIQSPLWGELERIYQGLEQLVERLQMICRPHEIAFITADLGPWMEERRALWQSWLREVGRPLEWGPAARPAVGSFDPMRLIQGLDALICWRVYEGPPGQPARLAWSMTATDLCLEWTESGCPIPGPLEGREGKSVSMTLPLLARIIDAHGGRLIVADRGGLSIRLEWPHDAARDRPA